MMQAELLVDIMLYNAFGHKECRLAKGEQILVAPEFGIGVYDGEEFGIHKDEYKLLKPKKRKLESTYDECE